jgi:uncharacterized protein YecT (DUF1311 family)
MLRVIILLSFFFSVDCCRAQTQFEMNKEAGEAFAKADKELNQVYQQILKGYATDTVFIGKLRASQKIWILFRDAEMEVKYSAVDAQYAYGSVFPMCWAYYKAQLTDERTKVLKQWVTGIEEGDVCSGSIRMK